MSASVRFLNFVIDSLAFGFFVFVIAALVQEQVSQEVFKSICILGYFLYYLLLESIFGKTIGKYFTKTQVVRRDQSRKPSFFQVFIRTISRLIPFYFLSYLVTGKGMHDHFSKTILIQPNSI